MTLLKTFIAAAALTSALGAHAQVAGSIGGGNGSFLALTSAGLDGGSVATLTGGSVYTMSSSVALQPAATVAGGTFLAAGTRSGSVATLDFGAGVSYVSFLWGSPDTWNLLTVNTASSGPTTFTAAGLGLDTAGHTANFVQFAAAGGDSITSLVFTNQPDSDAFETADFSVTPVPEPQTYALFAAGLGAVAFMARRRRV